MLHGGNGDCSGLSGFSSRNFKLDSGGRSGDRDFRSNRHGGKRGSRIRCRRGRGSGRRGSSGGRC